MSKKDIIKNGLTSKGIMVVKEEDLYLQGRCVDEGLAMLIIPEGFTEEEEEQLMLDYKDYRLINVG